MPTVVACTHCQTRCKLGDPLIGKVVKCPRCGKPFKAIVDEVEELVLLPETADDIATGPPPLGPVKARRVSQPERRRSARRQRDDESDDRPTRSRRSRKSSGNQNLIIGLCVGGGILVLGLVILAIVLLVNSGKRRSASAAPEVAAANAPEPAKPVQAAPQPAPQPATTPEPAKPVQAVPVAPPVVPDPPAQAAPKPPTVLGPGTKITVRADIQGSPPDFAGDYNKHVVQNVEIALRQLGYEPVPEGGLILQVRAQVGNSGKTIKVHTFGVPPPRVKARPGQPAVRNPPPRDAVYPIEQITATVLLTDAQGTALWRKESKFTPRLTNFRINPPREMQDVMWRMFDTWTQGGALATMKL